MPLTPEQYTGHEDYPRFGASAAGILEAYLRTPPSKRTMLGYYHLMDRLVEAAADAGIELNP